jgi:hypothetical protein
LRRNCLAASVVATLSVSEAPEDLANSSFSGEMSIAVTLRAKGPSELHCKVSQATYAENSQALTGHNPGALQGAINCESSTKKRGGFERRKTIWNFQRVSCRRLHKFGVATVNSDTCDLLPAAQVFVSFALDQNFICFGMRGVPLPRSRAAS